MNSFADQRVVITGGSAGIGKELARQWLALGAHVTIIADGAAKLEEARCELSAGGAALESAVCDIADIGAVTDFADAYVRRHGPPDVLVNNAGYAVYESFEAMDMTEIERLIQVNFAGACYVTRAFVGAMGSAGRGHIVLMASIAGRIALTPCGLYSAAKHGMIAWAETLQAELAHRNIRVHVICPGRVETAFFHHPSFIARAPRREAQRAVAVETVARATIGAVTRRAFFTYRPRVYRVVVWVAQILPLLSRPLLQRLMRARVAALAAPADAGDRKGR